MLASGSGETLEWALPWSPWRPPLSTLLPPPQLLLPDLVQLVQDPTVRWWRLHISFFFFFLHISDFNFQLDPQCAAVPFCDSLPPALFHKHCRCVITTNLQHALYLSDPCSIVSAVFADAAARPQGSRQLIGIPQEEVTNNFIWT